MIENKETIDENEDKLDQKESALERHRLEKKQLNGLFSLKFSYFN